VTVETTAAKVTSKGILTVNITVVDFHHSNRILTISLNKQGHPYKLPSTSNSTFKATFVNRRLFGSACLSSKIGSSSLLPHTWAP